MYELDKEIRETSAGAASLDDVLRALKKDDEKVSLAPADADCRGNQRSARQCFAAGQAARLS